MKGKNKLYIVMIILLIILIIVSFCSKILLDKSDASSSSINYLGDDIKKTYEIDYMSKYKDSIIYEVNSQISYSLTDEKYSLYGKIFIGKNKKLYISNEIIGEGYLLLDDNIKSIYKNEDDSIYGFVFYVLTENGKVYEIHLYSTDITKKEINEISLPSKAKYFTNAKVKSYFGYSTSGVVVMCEDNNMYYVPSGVMYSENIINIFDKYFIYEDHAITNSNRKTLVDSNGKYYYVDMIFMAKSPVSNLEYSPSILIFTEDDKLIYMIDDSKVLEYESKVDKLDYLNNGISIKFKNGKTIKIDGYYDLDVFN